MQDQGDSTRMFLIGQFFGRATVVKFNKINFHVEFKIEVKSSTQEEPPLSEMNEINSVAWSEKDPTSFYACGYKWKDPTKQEYSHAVTMKMKTNGEIEFLDVWVNEETQQRDSCKSVFFDEERNVAVYLMEVVRPTYKDALLVPMTPEGEFQFGAINIEYGFAPIDLRIGARAAFEHNGYYYFAGFSTGFNTKLQKIEDNIYDSHLFKINPTRGSSCLHLSMETSQWVQGKTTRYLNSQVAEFFSI